MRDDCVLYAVALGDFGGLFADVLELVLEVTHNNTRPSNKPKASQHLRSRVNNKVHQAALPHYFPNISCSFDEDGRVLAAL